MSSRIPIAPGTQLGRYQILGLAGEGGMGDIYRALDTSLERVVALKRVRSGRPDDATQERFRREALALAQLNHPGVCQVFELAETLHGTFIVMEWVEGETLADRLNRGPLPWREAARILHQVAEALTVAHAKGLVHRDLKPTNLMLTPEGQTKVLDFGLVRFADQVEEDLKPPTGEAPALTPEIPFTDPGDAKTYAPPKSLSGLSGSGRALTQVGIFMGTLGYTSPEQALARPVGPPSDIFGLGILAHEMVTGSLPFGGEGRAALDSVVDNQRKPIPHRRASTGYRALVDRMLARKPKERPTAPEVAKALEDLLSPHGPLWWSSLSAAAILLLVFGSYWIFGRGVLAGLVKGRPARLAVMGFRNETGLPALTAQTELGLADLVAGGLRKTSKLQVLDSDTLAQAAQAMKVDAAKASSADQLRLGKAVGVDLLLSGAVLRSNGRDQLRYTLTDGFGHVLSEGMVDTHSSNVPVLAAGVLATAVCRRIQKAVNPFLSEAGPPPNTISSEAFAAYADGVEAYRHGHFAQAEPLLAKAAYSAPEWGDAVSEYGNCLVSLSRTEANAVLNWALVLARKDHSPVEEAWILHFMARNAFLHRDLGTASNYDQRGLEIALQVKDPGSTANIQNSLGLLAFSLGNNHEALHWYNEALSGSSKAGNRAMEVQVLANLGNLALSEGNLPEAANQYQIAGNTAQEIGDESGEALSLNNLGITLLFNFKLSEAKAVLEHSLVLREKNGEARGVVSGRRNLGICFQMEGDLTSARTCFQISIEKAQIIGDAHGEGLALFYLSDLDRRSGDIRRALAGFQRAIEIFETKEDTKNLGETLAAKSECLMRQNMRSPASKLLLRAKDLVPGNPYLLRAQAWQAYLLGNKNKARELIDQAILDPNHNAPEVQPELQSLRFHFQSSSHLASSEHPSTPN